MKTIKSSLFNKYDNDEYITSLMEKHSKRLIYQKRLERIENEIVPYFHEYNFILKYNYNLNQLKSFVKHYKLKITGNKSQLIQRLFYHLYFSFFACKIQSKIRGFIIKKYMKSHGPASINRNLCVNTDDFLTVDNLNDIPFKQFFSYKDDDGFIYGFDIMSLYNLIYKCNGIIKNPYNRRPITNKIIEDLKSLLRLSKILHLDISTEINNDNSEITQEKSLELRILSLFQEIDSLGNFSNPTWFTNLNRNQLIKFVRELKDIWTFRAQLSPHVKILICPPLGDPFPRNDFITNLHNSNNIENMQKSIMDIMEKFINNSSDRDNKSLGAYYILGALTLVNEETASALPWLYQSFCYI
jgi:hypothetical protein